MDTAVLLVAAVLSVRAGGTSANSQPILASAGEAVLLPCQISDNRDGSSVEWSKAGLKPDIIFLYRHGCETFEMKNPLFQFRTGLFMREVRHGNFSLRISNLRPSDAGRYQCRALLPGKQPVVVATLELVVCAAIEPKLSVVPGDVETLQCEVNSSLPPPWITFLDHRREVIDAVEDPKHHEDTNGCFTITRRVAVPTESQRVTCRAQWPLSDQFAETHIYFTDKSTMNCTILCSSVGAAILGMGLTYWVFACVRDKRRAKAVVEKRDPQSHPLVTATPDVSSEFQRKIKKLETQLQEQKRINVERDKELKLLKSKMSPVTSQHDQPTFNLSPSKQSLKPISPKQVAANNGSPYKSVTKPGVGGQTSAGSGNSLAVASDSSRNSVSEEQVCRPRTKSSELRRFSMRQKRILSSDDILIQNSFEALTNLPED